MSQPRSLGNAIAHEAPFAMTVATMSPTGHYAVMLSRGARVSAPLLCAAILGVLSGCSGSGDEGDTATTTAAASVLTLAVTTTTAAEPPASVAATTMTTVEPRVFAPATTRPTESPASVSPSSASDAVDASAELAVSRPSVDPTLCAPLAAKEWEVHDLMMRPFAVHSESPVAMQVVANAIAGPTGPLALLLRYRDRPLGASGSDLIQINDWQVQLLMVPNGNADARWNLPEGGQAYLRARDLDRDTIIALIGGLQPRPHDAGLPGFDLEAAPGTQPDLAILHEDTNMSLDGRGAWFACQDTDTEAIYRVQTLAGDPLLQYTGIVDRPRPVDVGVVDDTVIVVSGPSRLPGSPFSADQVANTDQATWEALLAQPFP